MDEKIILSLLEESMDIDEGTLSPDDILEDMSEFDSLSKLAFIANVKEKLNISISINDVVNFVVVQDVIEYFK